MTPTLTQMQTWFDEFNANVFNNEFPRVKITFNNTRWQLGQFYWGNGRGIGIKISLFWERTEEQYRNCLLHEMCHLYCFYRGWLHEGHGDRWKDIADYAYRKTGLYIQPCNDTSGWIPSAKNNIPSIIVDLDYGDHHFLVRTTKNILQYNYVTDANGKIRSHARSYRVVISYDPLFQRFQRSRSIRRGYRYDKADYEKTIKQILDNGTEVKDLKDLFGKA